MATFTDFTEYFYKDNKLYLSWAGTKQDQVVRGLMGLGCIVMPMMVIIPTCFIAIFGTDGSVGSAIGSLMLLPISIVGVLIAFSKYEADVDSQNRNIRVYWRCLSLRKTMSVVEIPPSSQLRLRLEERTVKIKSNRGERKRTYSESAVLSVIPLNEHHGEGQNIVTQYHQKSGEPTQEVFAVRQLARILAKELQMELVDFLQDDEIRIWKPHQLDESVQQQWSRRIQEGETLPTAIHPFAIRSQVTEQYDHTQIDLPPLEWKHASNRIALLVVGVLLIFSDSSIILAIDPAFTEFIPDLLLIETVFLIFASYRLLKPAIWKDQIEINEKTLTLHKQRKKVTFPLSNLTEFVVGKEPKSEGIQLFRDKFSGGIIASDDKQRIVVGEQLSQEEVEYLHHLVLRKMIHIEDE